MRRWNINADGIVIVRGSRKLWSRKRLMARVGN